MRRTRSASPVGLTIAQRQAQLAAQIASSAASGVSHVAAATDATRNVAEQALATAEQTAGSIEGIVREHVSRSQADTSRAVDDVAHRLATQLTAAASGSVERSESRTRSMVDTLREELRAKFNEDHAAEEMRRGQAETRMTVLTANVENLHKKINELQVPDLSMLASMEKNLQNQMAANTVNASIEVAQLTKKVEEQSCNNEATVKLLDSLTQKIDQLSGSLSTVQADLQRWKQAEAEYDAGNVEEDMTDVGNATASVPMSVTPLTTTPSFVFGETSEIRPGYPTTSQTTVEWTNNLPPFLKPPKVSGGFPEFVPMTSWPSFEHGIGLSQPAIPISSVLGDSAAQGSVNAEVLSGNVTSTGQASLPPEAQKTISEICEQYLRQRGLTSEQAVHQNIGTRNAPNPTPSEIRSSLPTSSGVSDVGGPPPVIPLSPISVASTPPPNGGNGPFQRISQTENPQPSHPVMATAFWRPKEPPCFFGRSTEDVHTWTSLVRHYLAFMAGNDTQQVAYTVTLLRESAHEWYIGYERRNRGPPRDWAQLSTALLERFGSNIRSQEAQSQLMTISQGQRAVREYASQFETLLGRLDSYDEKLMLNQFIWGLQPELARSVSLHYPKSIATAVSLAETTELAVKASRRPGWKASMAGGSQMRAQGQTGQGRGRGGHFRGRGGNAGQRGRGNFWFPGRGRGRNFGGRFGQRSGGRQAGTDPLACYVCGVRGHLARDCPQNSGTSRGGRAPNTAYVQRGTGGNRSRGRRTRFSGLNVVYDSEGYEYPVDDNGLIYFPDEEQAGVENNEDQNKQEN